MKIELTKVSKRFNYDWIFRDVSYTFQNTGKYAITGHNGSGKSTLLRIISGQLSPSEGSVAYSNNSGKIEAENIFLHLTLAAPYLDLMDDLTFHEAVKFHSQFKPFIRNLSASDIETICSLTNHRNKYLRDFSSGMRQRVKLAFSVLTGSEFILLDEPTTNLDESGVKWYLDLIDTYCINSIVIVCSNQEREYPFCTEIVNIGQYKD